MEQVHLFAPLAATAGLVLLPIILGMFMRQAWQTLPLGILLVSIVYVPANLFHIELYDVEISRFPEHFVPRLLLATSLELALWAIAAILLALVGFGIRSLLLLRKRKV